jgi:hypothetical protein
MSLRDEIATTIERKTRGLPLALEATTTEDASRRADETEIFRFITGVVEIHREVILRLADEIDKLTAAG